MDDRPNQLQHRLWVLKLVNPMGWIRRSLPAQERCWPLRYRSSSRGCELPARISRSKTQHSRVQREQPARSVADSTLASGALSAM